MLAFSAVSILFLYGFLRVQDELWPPSPCRRCPPTRRSNTAVSFVTNTNWQAYSGESAMGHLVQMAGLAVQNFVSAAVGIAVAVALVRGFARNRTERLGNFWVDLTRITLRVLLPISFVVAIVFVGAGMMQNLPPPPTSPRWPGATSTSPAARSPARRPSRSSAPTAAASTTPTRAHPFENPTAWTNWLEIFLLL